MVVTVGIALIRVTPSNFLLESFLASVEGVKTMKSANNLEIIKTKQKKRKKKKEKEIKYFHTRRILCRLQNSLSPYRVSKA